MIKRQRSVAKVAVTGDRNVFLPVTSTDKPAISSLVMNKWQNIMDLAAKAIGVPAGLIMRLNVEDISVCISSKGKDNPYSPMEKEKLGIGLYCETVVGSRDTLHIPNALKDENWKENPDVKLGMISYLGMPLKWPDGEIFGTICVLDNKEHEYSETHIELLTHFRNSIESDLDMLLEREDLKKLNVEKALSLREAHHRIKNHLNMLTGVLQLSSFDASTSKDELIKDLTNRIRAIADLHTHIALAEESQVSLDSFIKTIATTITDGISNKDIVLHLDTDPVCVNRRTFFHTGLLVSELLTNAIKHAFTDSVHPEIAITLKNLSEDTFSLVVRDNGPGLPDNCTPKEGESIGMLLIHDIPEQIGGTYTVHNDNGTVYEFILEKRSGEIEE